MEAVANRLYQLFTNEELCSRMGTKAKELVTEEFFTVWNLIGWLYLFTELTNEVSLKAASQGLSDEEMTFKRNSGVGNNCKVSDLWRKHYNYNP